MQALKTHHHITSDYKNFLKSFINISDERIKTKVEEELSKNSYLPEPLIQFNPAYKKGESLTDFPPHTIHPDLINIIGNFNLYHHQVEAIKKGINGEGFIVTSGTGSGKSLTFLATIFNDILRNPGKGIRAIIVYPMNALINSQEEEIKKYEINYLKSKLPSNYPLLNSNHSLDEQIVELKEITKISFPVTYRKYTGQESNQQKSEIREETPDIILTNYMMLELIMTRYEERVLRKSISRHLKYLAFDELHTYRGRQGADVSMLIRRINNYAENKIITIGTSATMSSEGGASEKKKAVAEVANIIFDFNYLPDQIIGEQLETSTGFTGTIPSGEILARAINEPINPNGDVTDFVNNPLIIWLESRIALNNVNGVFERNTPMTLPEIAGVLSKDSGESTPKCTETIQKLLEWVEYINTIAKEQSHKSYLPFKLHQFISQTGTVKVTLDSKQNRLITLNDELYIKNDKKDTLLYPVLFSRYSGADFICVKLINNLILPRDPDNQDDQPKKITQEDIKADKDTGKLKRILDIDDFPYGYLILQEENQDDIWQESDMDYLPGSWFTNTQKYGQQIKNFYEHRLPRLLYFNQNGTYSWQQTEKLSLKAWYIPAYLLFDPTSGIIFDLKTNENTKLTRLGNEGRSSATTILGANILKTLHENNTLPENQKFLSFTDNRQDASLQAGHFNDFFTIARLRSAIYNSVKKFPQGLDCDKIGLEVYRELNLHEREYARYPSTNPSWPDEKNIKAIHKYILIRILYDLKLGWRYTTPNLEQTALVEIGYNRLDEFCRQESFFEKVSFIKKMAPEERQKILTQILNYFRTSFAFDHIYLTDRREEVENELKSMLDAEKQWSLDFDEKIEAPFILMPRPLGKIKTREYTSSIGPMSYLGKYVKRLVAKHAQYQPKQEEVQKTIEEICSILEQGHFLSKVPIKSLKEERYGYRIRVDYLLWKPSDEENILQDEVRFTKYKQITIKPNDYFKNFYKQDFKSFGKIIEGKEHTGQLNNNQRIERESEFRKGNLSALFCSPTMELGIDISQLNIVHLRNVPPRPDNYAQRSGRAGRSGQSALVYTFCSKGSPHDRNYFKSPAKMVHGVVVPPRLDITNEELIRSHLDAFILMELEIYMKYSVSEVIDIARPGLPIKPEILEKTEELVKHNTLQWIKRFRKITDSITGIQKTNWYNDNWLLQQISCFNKRFDKAFERWRILYTNAEKNLADAHIIISTPNHPGIRDARRTQAIILRQRDLLLNKNNASSGNESEFYVFRYLASEGFLPGYNFTRLPVRTFVGASKAAGQGEYISRPRFIALKEFGPNNLIYHNGNKYKITKMQLNQEKGELLQTLKISTETGYVFIGQEAKNVNNDPITNKPFQSTDSYLLCKNVVELNESEAQIEERISCNEENRVSQGYEIGQHFSFSRGFANTEKATVQAGGYPLLQIIYDQSATLLQVNNRWKVAKDADFPIGKISGRWKTRNNDTDTSDPVEMVKIYTTSTSDILYIQPIEQLKLSESGVITLAFALKQAIENTYQVEESEINVWLMGKSESRNILIYESVEGSLGILKDLLQNARKLQEVFREAYIILGFDPETHTDTRPDSPRASYDDVLSYYNQQYHDKLDRHSAKGALEMLMQCEIDNQQGNRTLEGQYQYLLEKYDRNSAMERRLLEYLYQNGYKLPDQAQVDIKELYINADFVYKLTDNQFALIFCDGTPHDDPHVNQKDHTKRHNCRDAGYEVIEWNYREPIEDFISRNKHIFRKVR